jgi:hypothetical protein
MGASPELRAHQEWLGLVQPVGLVVSPPALLAAQAHVNRNIVPEQQALHTVVEEEADEPVLSDVVAFTQRVLGWERGDLVPDVPDALVVPLPEYGDVLRPSYAVPDPDEPGAWLLLVQVIDDDDPFDAARDVARHGWHAAPQLRFERLLRETKVHIGVLMNRRAIRLVYAPAGETSGHLTFPVAAMTTVPGRPIFAALHMLLSAERLFALPAAQRLPALLKSSRKYQNDVSTRLAGQVLESLYELQRGFQQADDATRGELLREVLREAPDEVYGGLLTTILRLVFVLYAEDRGLLPGDTVYGANYSVAGLFEQLREDAARYPDTMDQRYGAWPRLLTLFRMLHDGAAHGDMRLPAREGRLFDPDAYPFLEGRQHRSCRVMGERLVPPRVPDGVIYRILEKLLVLDGDRLSYRALDVEQIGSVYEAMMGFTLITVKGTSIAVGKTYDVVDLDALLRTPAASRAKALDQQAKLKVTGRALNELKEASSVEALIAALGRKASTMTPRPVPPGAMLLQPTEERRRSGSHYTPRSLTEPIVSTTLRPVLAAFGPKPRPEQILGLNVCDPAMGSGAFLVETCRFLSDRLVEAWEIHDEVPEIPPDEDVQLHARRLVAQRCIYGVDRNPFAVDLAKLSLWLVTLAKDHPFTFVDHTLRQGDSLVGFSRDQIASFTWAKKTQVPIVREFIERCVREAERLREEIEALAGSDDTREKLRLLRDADDAVSDVRLIGDALVAAFFGGAKDRERKSLRAQYDESVQAWLSGTGDRGVLEEIVAELRAGEKPVTPFHWEVEFPEIFDRKNPGFYAFVGNPPFLGGTRISEVLGMQYFRLLTSSYPGAGHLCDLVAYFFRRAFDLLRKGGTLGFVATNTISQGDTREGGLVRIIAEGGEIYCANRRWRWPGMAAVVVSVVHVARDHGVRPVLLNGQPVSRISAYLVQGETDTSPYRLAGNPYFSMGSKIYGQGFIFANDDPACTPLAVRKEILLRHPTWERLVPQYISGEDINQHPQHSSSRYVIDLNEAGIEDDLDRWPELRRIVEDKVRPGRMRLGSNPNNRPLKKRWWAYQAHRPDLYSSMRQQARVLVNSQVSAHIAFAFQPIDRIFSHSLNVFLLSEYRHFAVMQNRVHELWARFFGSSMKDDLRYTPSDCFETFPFPNAWEDDATLEAVGKRYYEFRADLMVRSNEGLTTTYNRFHDPNERSSEILRLRELHDQMDRAVLDVYGWTGLQPKCEFLLDYEEENEKEQTSRRRRKPWRYRWPDELRDDVLARLLELNRQRAVEQGQVLADASSPGKTKPKVPKSGRGHRAPSVPSLFDE